MIDIQDSRYRISVKWLIFDDKGDVLLCKEENGKRDFPWWGIEPWETIEQCLHRELKEEMWLEVTSIEPRPLCYIKAEQPKSQKRPFIGNICYAIQVKHLDFTPSGECIEIWFFNKETIKTIDVFENTVIPIFEEISKNM